MMMKDASSEIPHNLYSEEKQEARAYLRERFLRVMAGLVGKKSEIHTVEKSSVTGKFHGSDRDIANFYMKQLETPFTTYPDALVRTSDIVRIRFPDIGNMVMNN